MKLLLITFIIALLTGLAACQTKPIKGIVASAEGDTATGPNKTKMYVLKRQTENADFNYAKLDAIDSHQMETCNVRNILPVFEPVGGQYNYYQFRSTYVGQSYLTDDPLAHKEFHDILIIKTDKKNKIIDAYHYTLEWAAPPLQYDVYRSSVTNIALTNNLDIDRLKLKRTYSGGEENAQLEEEGIIKLK